MALPDRFRTATFERYEATVPSQGEALRLARRFVRDAQRSLSWTQCLRTLWEPDDASSHGLYLVGPAGTGKTHLLAAAYNALPPEVPCAFLHSSELFRQTEPPKAFAHRLADNHEVCCLDEVEIDDPANEMRLVQVMKTLADRDVRLFATSNVEPDQYLSGQFSKGRFQRFLQREFQNQYDIVFVGGMDYRRTRGIQQSGQGWIGPPDQTRAAMQQVRDDVSGPSRWLGFSDFRRATTEIAHSQLMSDLADLDHLFIEDVAIAGTDDALRVLRVIDALYLHEDAPTLYFTAAQPPEAWFDPDQHDGVAQAVAEKFDRTVSRLYALCTIQSVQEEEPT
jgi:cell division protein ZapE